VTDEQPAEQRHRKRFDQPIHQQGDADALDMPAQFAQSGKIHLHQHRHDHHPDQQPDRQIDLGHLQATESLEHRRKHLSQRDSDNDAQGHPERQIAFEGVHLFCRHDHFLSRYFR
jgi:hypothetical protein